MKGKFQAEFHGFVIDSDQGVSFAGRPVSLHPKELKTLLLLVQCAGSLVTKEMLIKRVWGGVSASDESISRTISVIKSRLRNASPGAENLIKTDYGAGYRFIGQVGKPATFVNEESFFMLINSTRDLVILKDGDGRWQVVNLAALEVFQLRGKSWQGKSDVELIPISSNHLANCLTTFNRSDEAAWQARESMRFTETVILPDGSQRLFEMIKTPLFEVDGSRKALAILGQDVTERSLADRQLRLANRLVAQSDDAIMITDNNNRIVSVNQAFELTTGYNNDEIAGLSPKLLSSGRHDDAFYDEMWRQLQAEGCWQGEIWDRRKTGEVYSKWLNISTVHDADGVLANYIAIFSDMSRRKVDQDLLAFLAYHDPLTKLPNRLLLKDRCEQTIAAVTRDGGLAGLLFLDLDNFKYVNDTHGHEFGDRLLINVTRRLLSCVREVDTVSRVGGDEFVILLSDIANTHGVSMVAQKVLEHLTEPFEIDGVGIAASFSIGIALCPDDGDDFETLMKVADTAMYDAKNSGRNTYRFYTERMNIKATERLHLRRDLNQALVNEEFVLHYQPQFDLNSGMLVGMEALIRWNTAEHGLVAPNKFMQVAQETGQIVQIGEWVISEACRQAQDWQQQGYEPIRIAVNLSALHFKRGDVTEMIARLARDAGLLPQWLELELSESILLKDLETIIGVVDKLKSLSFSLSIDDFGTGYSSLTDLKRFKVDKLKIDQSFIRNLETDRHDLAIVGAIIKLADGLNLRTIAEGVETKAQAEALRFAGCHEAQGYYFSHPVAAKDATRFLTRS